MAFPSYSVGNGREGNSNLSLSENIFALKGNDAMFTGVMSMFKLLHIAFIVSDPAVKTIVTGRTVSVMVLLATGTREAILLLWLVLKRDTL
jgi:hypothetical protein